MLTPECVRMELAVVLGENGFWMFPLNRESWRNSKGSVGELRRWRASWSRITWERCVRGGWGTGLHLGRILEFEPEKVLGGIPETETHTHHYTLRLQLSQVPLWGQCPFPSLTPQQLRDWKLISLSSRWTNNSFVRYIVHFY